MLDGQSKSAIAPAARAATETAARATGAASGTGARYGLSRNSRSKSDIGPRFSSR